MSKFTKVVFPYFGLINVTKKIIYDGDIVFVYKNESKQKFVLDDRSLSGESYLARMFQMEVEGYPYSKLTFDITCRDVGELIRSKSKWGVTHKGEVHDLSNTNRYVVVSKKIHRVAKNYLWLKGISYPFKVPVNQDIPKDTFYGSVVYIDYRWFLLYTTSTKQKDTVKYL